MQLHNSFVNIQ